MSAFDPRVPGRRQSAAAQQPRLSILDRLLADQVAKGHGADPSGMSPRVMGELARRSLERDLEMLLSTRQCHVDWPQHLDAIATSGWNYGLPDYSGQNLMPRHIQEEFRRSIETTIRTFEPRLGRVSVLLADPDYSPGRTLRFRVEAVMYLDSEVVTFEASLDPVTHNVTVQTAQGS